jgi:NADH-quinone oxidoreductase subunit L
MLLSESTISFLFNLVPWIVFLPVLGLLVNLIFGGRMGEKAIGAIASTASGLAFAVSVLLGVALWQGGGEAHIFTLAEWIRILNVPWAFRVDTLSVTMMLVVSGVGTLIHVYAIGYMHEDVRFKKDERRYRRFFVFLNLFIAMMMILVSGDSYLMLFVGWEGVGLCSFLLIGFWYEMDTLGRPSWANSNAAKKAMIANRVGDFGFLLAAFTMFWAFGSLNFEAVFSGAADVPSGVILMITLFLLIGVAGKSAQIPLYVWLPDAMAGPTPVSALIHAATMVTAGVYLVARSWPLYSLAPDAQYIVAMVGAVTALFAATIAVGQYDIKKVLATRPSRSWASWWRRSGWAPSWPACSTWSRTPSSRRCCSSRPGRSSWGWSGGTITWRTASTKGTMRKCSTRATCATWAACASRCRSRSGCT